MIPIESIETAIYCNRECIAAYGVVWEAADGEGFHEGREVREGAHRRPEEYAAAPARCIAAMYASHESMQMYTYQTVCM